MSGLDLQKTSATFQEFRSWLLVLFIVSNGSLIQLIKGSLVAEQTSNTPITSQMWLQNWYFVWCLGATVGMFGCQFVGCVVYVVKEKVTKLTTRRVVNFGQPDNKAALFHTESEQQAQSTSCSDSTTRFWSILATSCLWAFTARKFTLIMGQQAGVQRRRSIQKLLVKMRRVLSRTPPAHAQCVRPAVAVHRCFRRSQPAPIHTCLGRGTESYGHVLPGCHNSNSNPSPPAAPAADYDDPPRIGNTTAVKKNVTTQVY